MTLEAEAELRNITVPTQQTLDKYGLSRGDWLQLLADQGWVCAVCLKDKNRWNTDHEHVAGWAKMPPEERKRYVRGVLCWFCNHKVVGSLRGAETAERIARYFEAYEQRRDAR